MTYEKIKPVSLINSEIINKFIIGYMLDNEVYTSKNDNK